MLTIKKLDTQALQDQVVDNIEAVEGRSLGRMHGLDFVKTEPR